MAELATSAGPRGAGRGQEEETLLACVLTTTAACLSLSYHQEHVEQEELTQRYH